MEREKTRLVWLDQLRFLALGLMFASHTVKTLVEIGEPSLARQPFFNLILLVEPLSSALFLFISGWCLNLKKRSFKKVLPRSVGLILISQLLYLYQHQSLPPLLTSSGILALIGWLWLLAPFWQRLSRPALTLISFLPLVIASLTSSLPLGLLNRGPFPFFPHATYLLAGILASQIKWSTKKNLVRDFALLLSASWTISLIGLGVFGWRMVADQYWQPRPALVITCLNLIFWLSSILKKISLRHYWWQFSRSSLIAYLTHLVFLQEVKAFIPSSSSNSNPIFWWGVLFLGCLLVSELTSQIFKPQRTA